MNKRNALLRQQVAALAARIMVEDALSDFHQAKRKAAGRLGLDAGKLLPSNAEVEAELRAYQDLFCASRGEQLRKLREQARDAMRFFSGFRPLLVGPVLEGTAGEHSTVTLHVYVDTPEDVSLFLLEHDIPHDQGEVSLRVDDARRSFPVMRFLAGETPVELVVLPIAGGRQPPRSPVDGRPMKRANLRQLESLLAESV